jgi:hypothetical protein
MSYLPKSLLGRIDRRANDLGMSRSSFFGFAANVALDWAPRPRIDLVEPRSKVPQDGAVREEKRGAREGGAHRSGHSFVRKAAITASERALHERMARARLHRFDCRTPALHSARQTGSRRGLCGRECR